MTTPASEQQNEREVLALDSTAISAWLECRKKYQLGYVENLVSIGLEKSPFGRGKVIHVLLEQFYLALMQGENRVNAMGFALSEGTKWLEESEDTKLAPSDFEFIKMRFMAYCNTWSSEFLRVLGVEVGFSTPILDTDKTLFVLEGRIDLIAENEKWGPYWVDHKSQSREYRYYGYTPQFLNYSLALSCRTGVVNYFGLQVSQPKNGYFFRDAFPYSQPVLDEWRFELLTIFSEISMARRAGTFRKNRVSCKHGLNYKCDYTHICEQTIPEFEAQIKRLEFTEREPWSPWSPTSDSLRSSE